MRFLWYALVSWLAASVVLGLVWVGVWLIQSGSVYLAVLWWLWLVFFVIEVSNERRN